MQTPNLTTSNRCSVTAFMSVLVYQVKYNNAKDWFFSFCKKGRWGAWGAWQLTTKPSLGPHLSSSQLMCAIVPLHYQWI